MIPPPDLFPMILLAPGWAGPDPDDAPWTTCRLDLVDELFEDDASEDLGVPAEELSAMAVVSDPEELEQLDSSAMVLSILDRLLFSLAAAVCA